ncbi:MAG: hypothetical protein L0387_12660 [Acidobacteria bacterium]|nr:hypothetical protein [Acidobacteriota bacterium]MCI0718540.1 hypothetical protein [Acidobacteriota bacterium]
MDKSIFVKGKSSILHKVVFELRYDQGFTYLDKCGRTVNEITRNYPDWMIKGSGPDPNNAALVSIKNGCLLNFSSFKYDLSLEKALGGTPVSVDQFTEFVDQVSDISYILMDQLGLKEFKRIGIREWHLFPGEDKESSERWLSGMGCYTISPRLCEAFDGKVESTGVTVIIDGLDRKFRIGFNQVERSAQLDLGQEILHVRASSLSKNQDKVLRQQMQVRRRLLANPEFAAMIDIDAFIEDPSFVDPRDFVETSTRQIEERMNKATQ